MRIAIIFGGPSEERGISINSARAVYEMLENLSSINIYYVDQDKRFFHIQEIHNMFSNTTEDFDFSIKNSISVSQICCDFAIPLIHGNFGEDGELQNLLEMHKIPYLFSNSIVCSKIFLKNNGYKLLSQHGYKGHDYILYNKNQVHKIQELISKYEKIIIKPNNGGSSIDTHCVNNYSDALEILHNRPDDYYICEQFLEGKEFSIIVYNGKAFVPLELIKQCDIFSYRNKYFPSEHSFILSCPSFSEVIIENIQQEATKLFYIIGARDIIRMDGFITKNNDIIFTDFNPIPSLEFNSLLYQSIPENNLYFFINMLNNALSRYNLPNILINSDHKNKTDIPVIFGGNSSERNVSILSACSVIIKLFKTNKYNVQCVFWYEKYVYEIPIFMVFKHNCQDILHLINNFEKYNKLLSKCNFKKHRINKFSLLEYIKKNKNKMIFLALHGGSGENGDIQLLLEKYNIRFNGEGSYLSRLCFHKYKTVQLINSLGILNIQSIHRVLIKYPYQFDQDYIKGILKEKRYIIKPCEDGSTTGISIIKKIEDLQKYIDGLLSNHTEIILNKQNLLLPLNRHQDVLLEEFIACNKISVDNKQLTHKNKSGWIELTIGFVKSEVFYPSITIARQDILTSEEKFQAGTGINLTPPPDHIISLNQVRLIRDRIKYLIDIMTFTSYARIDLFFNIKTNQIIIIEINTLPALTFATVLFQQALYSGYKSYDFIEKLLYL